MSPDQYRCPDCGFRIFNRRVKRCESCRALLPTELLYTREQIARLDAEHDKSLKETAARRRRESSGGLGGDSGAAGGEGLWDFGTSEGGGDGGGGD